jgi:class 3 adenylate cyclase
MTVTRKLAAILAADVAGYSRLMGADEEGTLERLKAHRRELIDPKIAEHHGRIVKTTGDGMLVQFGSVVDAVRCAVEVQQGMSERNADTPGDHQIEFRVGVNLGDIIIDGRDIHGDGVNIAARLEAIAEPGNSLHLSNRLGARKRQGAVWSGRSRRASIEEHRAARPCIPHRERHVRSSDKEAASAPRQAIDCGATVSEHERRPRTTILQRWCH